LCFPAAGHDGRASKLSPEPPFFNDIADVSASILAREAVEMGSDWLREHLVGCGPWQVVSEGTKPIPASKFTTWQGTLAPHPLPWWTPWTAGEPAPYFQRLELESDPSSDSTTLLCPGASGR
jgi:hypothetical protein